MFPPGATPPKAEKRKFCAMNSLTYPRFEVSDPRIFQCVPPANHNPAFQLIHFLQFSEIFHQIASKLLVISSFSENFIIEISRRALHPRDVFTGAAELAKSKSRAFL